MSRPSPVNSTGYGTVTPASWRAARACRAPGRASARRGCSCRGRSCARRRAASRLYRNLRPSWYLASLAKVRRAREAELLELALVGDLGGSVALVGEERRAAPVERAPLDDEHLGLLAGLEQPEDLVLGAASVSHAGAARSGSCSSTVVLQGMRAVRAAGPGRLAGRADAQVSGRSRRGGRRLRSSVSALLRLGPARRRVRGDSIAPPAREGKGLPASLSSGVWSRHGDWPGWSRRRSGRGWSHQRTADPVRFGRAPSRGYRARQRGAGGPDAGGHSGRSGNWGARWGGVVGGPGRCGGRGPGRAPDGADGVSLGNASLYLGYEVGYAVGPGAGSCIAG